MKRRYSFQHNLPIHWHTTTEADGRVTIHGNCRGHGYAFTVPKNATMALVWLAIDTVTVSLATYFGKCINAKPVGLLAGVK